MGMVRRIDPDEVVESSTLIGIEFAMDVATASVAKRVLGSSN
jgi:hypothetical protein